MSRLPVPGSDDDVWGDILNDYLSVAHNPDGTHKDSGTPDATTTTKGKIQLAGDLSGTASIPTVPGLASKASTSTQVATAGSLTGGGNLTTSRTLSLVNDSSSPGANRYYGTDGSGGKGYFPLPSADDMTGSEILSALSPVDGSGSGLDADRLDGLEGSAYLKSNVQNMTVSSTAPTSPGVGDIWIDTSGS